MIEISTKSCASFFCTQNVWIFNVHTTNVTLIYEWLLFSSFFLQGYNKHLVFSTFSFAYKECKRILFEKNFQTLYETMLVFFFSAYYFSTYSYLKHWLFKKIHMVGGGVVLSGNNTTSWLHLASWNLPDSQIG